MPSPSKSSVGEAPGHPPIPSKDQVDAAVRSLALLAEPTRLRMLWTLKDGPRDVTTLAEAASVRAATASQHLAKLRLGQLVTTTKDGRHVMYQLSGGHVHSLLIEAMAHADHQVTGKPLHD